MAKRLLENMAAEKEADRIGAQFANSNDVVGDMGRKYDFDFSSVNLHGGAEGASMAESHGDLAYAQGKDAYFGGDLLNKHTPEANMAVGHELTHVMQQNDGAGVSEHVPFGEGQGLGFFKRIGNWFKNLFSRKKKPKAKTEEAAQEETATAVEKSPNLNAAVRYKPLAEKSYEWFGGRFRSVFPSFFDEKDTLMRALASKCDNLETVDLDYTNRIIQEYTFKLNAISTTGIDLNIPLSNVVSQINDSLDSVLPDFQEYSSYVQAMGGDVSKARENYEAIRSMIEQLKAKIQEILKAKFQGRENEEEEG